jgi:CBS domain-containing protein
MQRPLSDLLRKGGVLIYVTPNASVQEAVDTMAEHNVGSVLVLEGGSDLAGIFTERDLLKRVVHEGLDPKATPITDVMTEDVVVVTGEMRRSDALDLMEERHFRHLVVADEERLYGMISMRDLLQFEREAHEVEVEQMRDYVMRKPYPTYPS